MSKHSKGPWQVGKRTEFGTMTCGVIMGENADGIAQILGMPTNGTLEDLPEQFAEAIANARLISAAPELLEVLIALRDRGHTQATWMLANRAIAKATGESP